jgi:Rieske 2Fe-2S family protein
MNDDFDKSSFGLKKLHCEQLFGMIFVSFSDQPLSFEMLKNELGNPLKVFDIENTRVAHHESHPIHANWKLVFENFNECYHCGPAHKEFSASHSLMLEKSRQQAFDEIIARRAPGAGISADPVGLMQIDQKAQTQAPFFYDRYALFKDYLTGSEDGQSVAPLLGEVSGYDGGASNVQLGNLTYLLIYCDHIVLYRFTPRSVNLTDAELIWFVRADADLEQDVDIERMIWLWNVTTLADKDIIERNQKGVLSRFYKPGPYAPMETYTINFIKWYLDTLRQ